MMKIINDILQNRREQKVEKWTKQYKIKPEKKRLAKAYVMTDSGTIVPYSTLADNAIRKPGSERSLISKAANGVSDSQQIRTENDWVFDSGLAPRPFAPSEMLALLDNNPYFGATVGQIAVDVAGLGHSLILREGAKENPKEREIAEKMLESPDDENTFHEVCKRWVIDWGYCGWCAFEIRRDGRGLVGKVNHIMSENLWVHQSGDKYAQKAGTKTTWFNKYDTELDRDKRQDDISSETGTSQGITSDNKANELIFYKEYHPGNSRYGIPKIYSAVGSVVGMIGERDFNLSFLKNFGVPAYIILLEGDWDDNAEKIITDFMKECKGPSNAHKTMIFTTPEGCKLTLVPIAVKVEEGSFKLSHKIWKEEILASYRMPEYRLGIAVLGSLGGSIATEMTEIYKQSIVEPTQTILEHIWSNMIFRDGMGIMNYVLKFKDMETRDLDTEIERTTMLVRHGLLNRNDGRKRLELGEPYEGGDEYLVDSSLIPTDLIGEIIPEPTSKSVKSAKLPKYVINLPETFVKNIVKGKINDVTLPKNMIIDLNSPMALSGNGNKLYGFITFEKMEAAGEGFRYDFKFSALPKPLPVRIKFGKLGDIISDDYRIVSIV